MAKIDLKALMAGLAQDTAAAIKEYVAPRDAKIAALEERIAKLEAGGTKSLRWDDDD